MSDAATGRQPDPTSLSQRTFTAAQWRFLSAVVEGGLHFGVGILLARLLPPKDFGLLALALFFTGLAGLFSTLGLGPAIIQRRPLTKRHVRVGFTLSVLLGAGTGSLLFAVAPFSTLVFANEELPDVLRLVALTFLFSGVGNTSGALLNRRLDFRRLFWIGTISYVVGYALVAVPMAVIGFGVWSLATGAVVQSFLRNAILLGAVRHPLKPLLARRELRELTGLGLGFSLSGFVHYGALNGDNFVVGRWMGDDLLGLYTRAYTLMMLPQQFFGQVVRTVLFAAFAEVQDDRQRMGRAYLTSVQLITILAFPVLAGMIVAAPHMIVGLYGSRWAGAVAPLQILCACGLFRALYPLSKAVAQAAGKVYWALSITVVYAMLVVGGGIALTKWGISGVALAVGSALLVAHFGGALLTLRIVGLRWRDFFNAQLSGILVGLAVGAAAVVVRLVLESYDVAAIWIFAALVATCGVTFLSGLYFLPPRARPSQLYGQLEARASRLPRFMRAGLSKFLRLEAHAESL